MAELRYERFLAIEFPRGLDFSPRNPRQAERSKVRFVKWLTRKDGLAKAIADDYRAIADIRGGGQAWRIAAAARTGQVFQNFADGLYTAEVPRDQRTGPHAEETWNAYCDELTARAGELEETSVQAFGFCLSKSAELNWFNSWSTLCERELGQIRPQEYPTAAEAHATANHVSPIVDFQQAILQLR